MKGKTKFNYRPRTTEDLTQRSRKNSGDFDSPFDRRFKLFTPGEGDHRVRILPPTWEDARHFGIDVFIHYSVGGDQQAYLCPHKMRSEPCPICEESNRAALEGDADYAKELKPVRRVLVWMINRKEEDDGPVLWSMPWTFDRELVQLSVDSDTGEIIYLDHPDEGFDIVFKREGKGLKTQYSGLQISRRAAPISKVAATQDEWIDFIVENPLPSVLQYYDYDYIADVFTGAVASKKTAAPEAPATRATRSEKAAPAKEEIDDPDEDLDDVDDEAADDAADDVEDVDDADEVEDDDPFADDVEDTPPPKKPAQKPMTARERIAAKIAARKK